MNKLARRLQKFLYSTFKWTYQIWNVEVSHVECINLTEFEDNIYVKTKREITLPCEG